MLRAEPRVKHVARDEELRVGYVALGGRSPGRPAAQRAKALAVFDVEVGRSHG